MVKISAEPIAARAAPTQAAKAGRSPVRAQMIGSYKAGVVAESAVTTPPK